jgi:hypothetical protein
MKYLIFLLVFSGNTLMAQLTMSYFPWQSMLGITQSFPKNFAIDYKIETNSFFNNMNMEIGGRRYYQVNGKIDHAGYLEVFNRSTCHYGLGVAFNPNNFRNNLKTINGYYLDLGIRWTIPKREFLYLILECSPFINQAFTNGNLRTRLGIGYRINK